MSMWNWFVAPLGVTEIGLAWSIGLSALISYGTYELNDIGDENKTPEFKMIVSITYSIVVLAFGFLINLFM